MKSKLFINFLLIILFMFSCNYSSDRNVVSLSECNLSLLDTTGVFVPDELNDPLHPKEHAIDGDLDTFWVCDLTNDTDISWLYIMLDQSCLLTKITISFDATFYPEQFLLAGSDNIESWAKSKTVFFNGGDYSVDITKYNLSFNYIGIGLTGLNDDYIYIKEFEVWGLCDKCPSDGMTTSFPIAY